jgi:hypothetical protein
VDTSVTAQFPGASVFNCSQEELGFPDMGLSDVEPKKFYGQNVPRASSGAPAVWYATDPAPLDAVATPVFINGFGVAVTKDDAGAPIMPALSSEQLAALLAGVIGNWRDLGGPDLPVRICRRTPGSGTQATFNLLVSRSQCASPQYSQEVDIAQGDGSFVIENNTTSQVKACLSAARASGLGALGLLGLENNEAAADWEFADINGAKIFDPAGDAVDGSLDRIREDRIISGLYPLWVESTLQKRLHGAPLSARQEALYTFLVTNIGDPLFTKTLPGIVSLAAYWGAFPGASRPDPSRGIGDFTRDGDTCNTSKLVP